MYINWRNKAKKTVWLKVCQPPPPKQTGCRWQQRVMTGWIKLVPLINVWSEAGTWVGISYAYRSWITWVKWGWQSLYTMSTGLHANTMGCRVVWAERRGEYNWKENGDRESGVGQTFGYKPLSDFGPLGRNRALPSCHFSLYQQRDEEPSSLERGGRAQQRETIRERKEEEQRGENK